jgi:hypothetical protein
MTSGHKIEFHKIETGVFHKIESIQKLFTKSKVSFSQDQKILKALGGHYFKGFL